MSEHTPGPWEYDTELHEFGKKSTPIYSEAPGIDAVMLEPVCIIPHDAMTEEGENQVEANAALIASAPALLKQRDVLLAALKEIKSGPVTLSVRAIASFAIAEAEKGE